MFDYDGLMSLGVAPVLWLRLILVSNLDSGCLCRLTVFLFALTIWFVDSPETGYLSFEFLVGVVGFEDDFERSEEKIDFFAVSEVEGSLCLVSTCHETGLSSSLFSPGCLGITNALVCFNRLLSLHKADIRGKSKLRLFSRNEDMSNKVSAWIFLSNCLRGVGFALIEANPANVLSGDIWKKNIIIIISRKKKKIQKACVL
jgi:hypothetical protein